MSNPSQSSVSSTSTSITTSTSTSITTSTTTSTTLTTIIPDYWIKDYESLLALSPAVLIEECKVLDADGRYYRGQFEARKRGTTRFMKITCPNMQAYFEAKIEKKHENIERQRQHQVRQLEARRLSEIRERHDAEMEEKHQQVLAYVERYFGLEFCKSWRNGDIGNYNFRFALNNMPPTFDENFLTSRITTRQEVNMLFFNLAFGHVFLTCCLFARMSRLPMILLILFPPMLILVPTTHKGNPLSSKRFLCFFVCLS